MSQIDKTRRVKILFLGRSSPPFGGVARWMADLIPAIDSKQVQPLLALSKGANFHDPETFLNKYQELRPYVIDILDGTTGERCGRRISIRRVLRKTQPDIVVPVLLYDALEVAAADKSKKDIFKVILPVHENDVWALNDFMRFEDRIDMVVSVNRLFCKVLRSRNWPVHKLRHIRSGVPTNKSQRDRRVDSVMRILYCGELDETQKRTSDLIEIAAQLKMRGLKFSITVAGSGSFEDRFVVAMRDRQLGDNLHMLGFVQPCEMRELYSEFDVLIITSYGETGPIVAWEAMMNGLPVVSSKYRGIVSENVLRNNETALLFSVGDVVTAAKLIDSLAKNKDLYERISNGARDFATKSLNVENMSKEWDELLRELVSRRNEQIGSSQQIHDTGHQTNDTFRAVAKHYARKILRKYCHHVTNRQEWPSYSPQRPTNDEINKFDNWLWMLDSWPELYLHSKKKIHV